MPVRLVACAVLGVLAVQHVLLRRHRAKPPVAKVVTGIVEAPSTVSARPRKGGAQEHQPQVLPPVPQERNSWIVCSALELRFLLLQAAFVTLAISRAESSIERPLALTLAAVLMACVFAMLAPATIAAAASTFWPPSRWQFQSTSLSVRSTGMQPTADVKLIAGSRLHMAGGGGMLPPPKCLTGVWDKDKAASDSMNSAINAMRLNPILRRAVSLVRGVEIVVSDEEFEMAVFSVIPWFKVIERYPLSGEERSFKRRDLRKGGHIGRCEVLPGNQLAVHVKWGSPLSGHGSDTFHLVAPDVMHVNTVMAIDGGPVLKYRMVYHRRQQDVEQ